MTRLKLRSYCNESSTGRLSTLLWDNLDVKQASIVHTHHSSPPLPPLFLNGIKVPNSHDTQRRPKQQRPIKENHTPIIPQHTFPQNCPTDRTPKQRAHAPHEIDEPVDTGISTHAEHLGDRGREESIIATGKDAVEDDEQQPERAVSVHGAAEPQAAHRRRAADDGEDERVLPPDAVACPAGQDAAGGVDAVVDGQQDGAEAGAVAQDGTEFGQEGQRDQVAAGLQEGRDGGQDESGFQRDGAVDAGEAAAGEAGGGDGQGDGEGYQEVEDAEEA